MEVSKSKIFITYFLFLSFLDLERMGVKIQREMTGLVQETHLYHSNHQKKKVTQMAGEPNSQLTYAQSQVRKLKEKKNQSKTMVSDQELIQLNCQITSHNILLVRDSTPALGTKIISNQERLMDLVQVHTSYHHQSKLENRLIIESFFFII